MFKNFKNPRGVPGAVNRPGSPDWGTQRLKTPGSAFKMRLGLGVVAGPFFLIGIWCMLSSHDGNKHLQNRNPKP